MFSFKRDWHICIIPMSSSASSLFSFIYWNNADNTGSALVVQSDLLKVLFIHLSLHKSSLTFSFFYSFVSNSLSSLLALNSNVFVKNSLPFCLHSTFVSLRFCVLLFLTCVCAWVFCFRCLEKFVSGSQFFVWCFTLVSQFAFQLQLGRWMQMMQSHASLNTKNQKSITTTTITTTITTTNFTTAVVANITTSSGCATS